MRVSLAPGRLQSAPRRVRLEESDRMVEVTPNPRCDCESAHCEDGEQQLWPRHTAGACASPARYVVRAFGIRQKLCRDCLMVAKQSFPDRIEIVSQWE